MGRGSTRGVFLDIGTHCARQLSQDSYMDGQLPGYTLSFVFFPFEFAGSILTRTYLFAG